MDFWALGISCVIILRSHNCKKFAHRIAIINIFSYSVDDYEIDYTKKRNGKRRADGKKGTGYFKEIKGTYL